MFSCDVNYFIILTQLGESYTKPMGSLNCVQYRVVDMYTHCTHASVRNTIQHYFTTPSPSKIVIATTAFGHWVNCPNVRQIILWGVPEDWEMYVEEVVELVGMESLLVLFYLKYVRPRCQIHIKTYD